MRWRQWLGARLASYLSHEPPCDIAPEAREALARVAACLQPGDVILVEGSSRFSMGIKFLTQSTWSHAALYVGDALANRAGGLTAQGHRACVVEADLVEGVRAVGLELYAGRPVRICRAVSLSEVETQQVVAHAISRIGQRYDLKHIIDLMRWLSPKPLLPARWKRNVTALGSGDPMRAICSMLVAEAIQSVRYPILPRVERMRRVNEPHEAVTTTSEVLHLRHASLFVPRDFDLSPYFEIVKPALVHGFDHRRLVWGDQEIDPAALDELMAGAQAAQAHPPVRGKRGLGIDVVDALPRSAPTGEDTAVPAATSPPGRWRRWLDGARAR
ncbi:MAG: lipo-like protein [Burkholderiales bacterium]|nr:lipo-like protein [Burkholderiales bacterium]